MRITCPACQASYQIPDHLLVQTPERVRCARCGAEWAWARALAGPAEHFDLPDLFSDSPAPHAALEPVPDLSALTDPNPTQEAVQQSVQESIREPIGSPVFDIDRDLSLPPPQPLDRLMPPEPPAHPLKIPDEPVVQEAPPLPEPPPRRETPVEIPEVPFSKAPAAASPRPAPPPPVRMDTPVEIPRAPFPREPKIVSPVSRPTVSDLAHERAMSREEAFRRVIETTRQRSLTVPKRPSRRPQIIAILAVILLIAVIFGVHFAMVHGVGIRPAG